MAWLKAGYVVGTTSGAETFLDGADFGQAVEETKRMHPRSRILYEGDLFTTMHEQPDEWSPNADPKRMPRRALEAAGMKRIRYRDVQRMSYQEAHERLRPYFYYPEGTKDIKGRVRVTDEPILAYQKPAKMRQSWLTVNAKFKKGLKLADKRRGLSRGPNLVPHALAQDMSRLKLPMKGNGLCVGSNPGCRSICLVYSGNNPYGDKTGPGKLRKTETLLLEPVAWSRMFIESIKWHVAWCKKNGVRAYVRPNVLSDIPWELVLPELFTKEFPRVPFYDYTKVAGRQRLPRNYDLTFSFNGTNERLVEYEMKRGRKVAVVFFLPKPKRGQRKPEVTDLKEFMGRRIIDGDEHDFRPLDKPGVVVGLTYKPAAAPGTVQKRYSPPTESDKFVIRAMQDPETGVVVIPQTPDSTGAHVLFDDVEPTMVA
jgi:hypothetical protein